VGLFEKAAQLEPQSYNIWGNLADAYRWATNQKDRARVTYERAIGLAEQALEANPRDTDALCSLALYKAKSGEPEKARQLVAKALAIAPKDVDVLGQATEVYTVADDEPNALDCLEKAIRSGYPRFEIEANPEFAKLRDNPRYREITNKGKHAVSDSKWWALVMMVLSLTLWKDADSDIPHPEASQRRVRGAEVIADIRYRCAVSHT